ncbi:MAG: hypothetical protein KF720_11125 [Rubrivivax sp.]|nr:hypothetical protein [Rubrivivax sp.]
MLVARVCGLRTPERWIARHNPALAADTLPGRTHWFTLGTVVFALCFGATALMFSIVLSVQRYFEHQIEQGRKISQ